MELGPSWPAETGDFVKPQDAQVLAWNKYSIEVRGDVITVNLNGVGTAKYNTRDTFVRWSCIQKTVSHRLS